MDCTLEPEYVITAAEEEAKMLSVMAWCIHSPHGCDQCLTVGTEGREGVLGLLAHHGGEVVAVGVTTAWSRKVNGGAPVVLRLAPCFPFFRPGPGHRMVPPTLSVDLSFLLGKLSQKHPEVCMLNLVEFTMKISHHHA